MLPAWAKSVVSKSDCGMSYPFLSKNKWTDQLPSFANNPTLWCFPNGLCAKSLIEGKEPYYHNRNNIVVGIDGDIVYMTCANPACKIKKQDVSGLQLVNKHSQKGDDKITFQFVDGSITWLMLTNDSYSRLISNKE